MSRLAILAFVAIVFTSCNGEAVWRCEGVGQLREIHYGKPVVVRTSKGVFALTYPSYPSGVFGEPVWVCSSDVPGLGNRLMIGGRSWSTP